MLNCPVTLSMLNACGPEHVDPDPPAVLTPPLSLTVSEGAACATLTCRVKGQPSPAVTWTHQGSVLLTDAHYTVTKEGDTHSLQILNPQTGDAGEYVCHVHNIAGTVTATCTLTVTASAAEERSAHLRTRDATLSQAEEDGEQTEVFDQGSEPPDPNGQLPARHSRQTASPPPSLTPPSKTSSSTNSATSIFTSPNTFTSRMSRASTPRAVAGSPSRNSDIPAFGVGGIRVGSVRKRRDWFEQRASPSPDRGSSQGASRRSAGSQDRHRQAVLGDGTPAANIVKKNDGTPACSAVGTGDRTPSSNVAATGERSPASSSVEREKTAAGDRAWILGRADRQRQPASGDSDSASGAEDTGTASRDVLTPAIYQIRTTPSSAEHSDGPLTVPCSAPLHPATAETGSSSSVPDTSEPRPSTAGVAEGDSDVHRDPACEDLREVSADTRQHRALHRAAGGDGLRMQSPGRVDFRSVLRTRHTEGREVPRDHTPVDQPRTDFRSVLRKIPQRDSAASRLCPELGETDRGQTTDRRKVDDGGGGGGSGQADQEKADDGQTRKRQNGSDVYHSMGPLSSSDAKKEERKHQTRVSPAMPDRSESTKHDSGNVRNQDSVEPQAAITQSTTITPHHTEIITPTSGITTETSEKPTPLPQTACTVEPASNHPEHSERTYVTSAHASIKLSAPVQELHPPSSSRRDDPGQGRRDDAHMPRTAEGPGVVWEAPRVLQDLQDQRVSYGGQAVMRCAVTGRPAPEIAWTLNSKDVKPSRFFQMSYQEPHAQLLVAEAYSEDEGEYTCTATNRVGATSSSCYLTVDGVSKNSVSKDDTCDVSTESTPLPEPGSDDNDHDIIQSDVTERMASPGGEQTTNAEDSQKVLHSVSNAVEKRFPQLNAAGGHSQPISDNRCTDVTGADDVSLATEGDVIMDLQGARQGPGTWSPSEHPAVVFVPGRKFEDYYDCVREVGRGKFGSVYECQERETGVVLAAKVMKVRGEGQRGAVRREVEVMNALCHPMLLFLKDAFEARRSMVLVTEFVGGGELLERVCNEQYVLTENDCVRFLRQLCEGVAHMHGKGVVHLDLKPNNVLCVDPESTDIKIIDFGLARFYNPGDSLHVLHGTPEFIAPEVINYDDISFATDMWSVGVIAYILLSGLSPFLGDDDADTLANVTRGEYDFDDDSFDVISEDAKDFISCLLLKRKEKRMSVDQCRRHAWLTRQNDRLGSRRLNTDNLRSFVTARRKRLQTAAQAIMAMQRMYRGVTGGSSTSPSKAAGESTSS